MTLMAELEALRRSCAVQDWQTAAALLQAHDKHVRSAHRILPVAELVTVLEAQRVLLTEMMAWRDDAAQRLGEIQRATVAARAYGNGALES